MSRWYGKLFGACLGIFLLRGNPLLGLAIGLLVGHAFDADWFGRAAREQPYKVLGVGKDAPQAEVERAYRRLISQYHPDKYVDAAPELRAKAEKKAREINAAYDQIQKLRKHT